MKIVLSSLAYIAAVLAVISPVAFSQETDEKIFPAPFGLEWGMTQNQLSSLGVTMVGCTQGSVFTTCTAKSLPKDLPDVHLYALLFSPPHGLVKVAYLSNDITGDIYGTQGKKRYAELKSKLTAKYGYPDSYENSGQRLYKEADEFYQCLRYDGCGSWKSFYNTQKTRGTIVVALEIVPVRRGIGFIQVGYESAGFHIAKIEEKTEESQQEDDAL